MDEVFLGRMANEAVTFRSEDLVSLGKKKTAGCGGMATKGENGTERKINV